MKARQVRRAGSQARSLALERRVERLTVTGELEGSGEAGLPPSQWSLQQVCDWVEYIGLRQLRSRFIRARVTGQVLVNLTDEKMKSELKISVFEHRRYIVEELSKLSELFDKSGQRREASIVIGERAEGSGDDSKIRFHFRCLEHLLIDIGQSAPGGMRDLSATPPNEWTTAQVCKWLEHAGLPQYRKHFRHAGVSGRVLVKLSLGQLQEDIGILITSHCDHILAEIQQLVAQGSFGSHGDAKAEEAKMGHHLLRLQELLIDDDFCLERLQNCSRFCEDHQQEQALRELEAMKRVLEPVMVDTPVKISKRVSGFLARISAEATARRKPLGVGSRTAPSSSIQAAGPAGTCSLTMLWEEAIQQAEGEKDDRVAQELRDLLPSSPSASELLPSVGEGRDNRGRILCKERRHKSLTMLADKFKAARKVEMEKEQERLRKLHQKVG
mmetsp:Transcript_26652/g.48213  ORF Transcript_26652/g.48213 Transcript_26652/m.48213 type:complete len:442 (+) Transcript_26652:3-1328(+)